MPILRVGLTLSLRRRQNTPEHAGQTHLDIEEDYLHVRGAPPSEQASTGDAAFAGILSFQEILRYVAQDREVLRGVILALSTLVFTEGYVEHPEVGESSNSSTASQFLSHTFRNAVTFHTVVVADRSVLARSAVTAITGHNSMSNQRRRTF